MITLYYRRGCYGNISYNESIQVKDIIGITDWIKSLDSSLGCERVKFNLDKEYFHVTIRVGSAPPIIGKTSSYRLERIESSEGILFDSEIKHCSRIIKNMLDELKDKSYKEKPLIP